MDPQLRGDRLTFNPSRPQFNFYRLMLLLTLILGGLWLLWQVEQGAVQPLSLVTPTATRTANSYVEEARALFEAGKLLSGPNETDALEAYQEALRLRPDDAELWAELARAQTYSSALLSTDEASRARLEEARESIRQAVELAPQNSNARAIHALVLDWLATNALSTAEQREELLALARQEAQLSLDQDPGNSLALTYFAEVLLDQQNWLQAQQYIEQAIAQNPDVMDTRRVYATVLESLGQYRDSITWYERAAELAPNLTFLYIRIGITYRELGVFDQALEFFAQAASINQQIGVQDPTPYIGIAKTYIQQGEFFSAALNAEKALEFDPTNANTYGQLGIIYIKSRNFEGAMPVLQCAVEGCSAEENEIGGVDVRGQPLTSSTLEYYLRYGSVLAALSREGQNYCPRALEVMDQVIDRFPEDATSISVVQENRLICSSIQ